MKSPITSWPSWRKSHAATLLSTPPDIAKTTRDTAKNLDKNQQGAADK